MESVFGRHNLSTKTISGVYKNTVKNDGKIDIIDNELSKFVNKKGRRPRMVAIGILGCFWYD